MIPDGALCAIGSIIRSDCGLPTEGQWVVSVSLELILHKSVPLGTTHWAAVGHRIPDGVHYDAKTETLSLR